VSAAEDTEIRLGIGRSALKSLDCI